MLLSRELTTEMKHLASYKLSRAILPSFMLPTIMVCAALAALLSFIGEAAFAQNSSNAALRLFDVVRYADGGIYRGYAIGDRRDGFGQYTYANGQVYEGQWLDNKKHGFGVFRWPKGDVYYGGWNAGKREGPGTLIWADGGVFRGLFQNDESIDDPGNRYFIAHLMHTLTNDEALADAEFGKHFYAIVNNKNDHEALEYFIGVSGMANGSPKYLDMLGQYLRSDGSIDKQGLRADMLKLRSRSSELALPKLEIDYFAELRAKAVVAQQTNGLALLDMLTMNRVFIFRPTPSLQNLRVELTGGVVRDVPIDDAMVTVLASYIDEVLGHAAAVSSKVYGESLDDLLR